MRKIHCSLILLASMTLTVALGAPTSAAHVPQEPPTWAHGPEGQRKADLGNGTYLNPVMPGDHPDPSILKVGRDYYLVNSSFDYTPGLLVWHSRDLVNWEPVGPALRKYVGTVWAPDLCRAGKRYYIYFPVLTASGVTNMVVYADSPRGPWSDPVDLKVGNIDPALAVNREGKRFLFLSGGYRAPLSDDGLSVTGPAKKIYDGWQYPKDWVVETFAQEGPKIMHHGDFYYMVLAEGGTAGPATSHMVVMARSKTLDGPWVNSPYNPIVHTRSASEKWWSRGHGTLVEGPDGRQWYLVYHAYEKGHYNLGRQTLLEPVEWTADGWVKASGFDVAKPIPMPAGGTAVPNGFAYSDDFATNKVGIQWALFRADPAEDDRVRVENHELVMRASGTTPRDAHPLCFISGDHNYQIQVEVDSDPGATGGLLLFYSDRLFAGLGFSDKSLVEYGKGETSTFPKPAQIGRHYFLRLRLYHDVMTMWYSPDGVHWTQHWMRFEVSGYNHNVVGGFLSLRPALFAGGSGFVRFRHFEYRALPE